MRLIILFRSFKTFKYNIIIIKSFYNKDFFFFNFRNKKFFFLRFDFDMLNTRNKK